MHTNNDFRTALDIEDKFHISSIHTGKLLSVNQHAEVVFDKASAGWRIVATEKPNHYFILDNQIEHYLCASGHHNGAKVN